MTTDDPTRRTFLERSAGIATGLFALGCSGPRPSARSAPTGGDDVPLSVQEISDRLEIQDLLVRYCYAIDDRDWDAFRAVFTADAVIDNTETGGPRTGVDETVRYLQKALAKTRMSQHAISTTRLELRGDEASARTHCSCPMVVDVGDGKTQVFFQGLWYRDRLVRTRAGWRLAERVEEGYWAHNVPTGFKF
jgi:SnoaL-like domain